MIWTIKKAECRRIDNFELWCCRRLLRVPWAARRSNQSILNEISPEYSLEGLMLKLQYFGHLMWRTDSLEKALCWERLKAGEGDVRGWDGWMTSLTWWTWVSASFGRWRWTGYISLFLPCFLLLFFSQLCVRPPQTAILLFCISFSWGWSWFLSPVQCHEPPSIVDQALCLSDLAPYIYFSLHLNAEFQRRKPSSAINAKK